MLPDPDCRRRRRRRPASTSRPGRVHALIAARLDTLTPERKALLQDASVVGKVFWAGARRDMGGRTRARSSSHCTSSRARSSCAPSQPSIEGEDEYSFWHGLVRDVAYEQIPRGERARRHGACAEWLAALADDGLGDTADIIAHHYEAALALSRADGDDARAHEFEEHARRYLVMAGQRTLALDPSHAAARFASALALTPRDDASYADISFELARAHLDAGEIPRAAEELEGVIAAFRDSGRVEQTAEALGMFSRWRAAEGDERFLGLSEQAVALLEPGRPAPSSSMRSASSRSRSSGSA